MPEATRLLTFCRGRRLRLPRVTDWGPPGNNMTETIMTMLDAVGTATPQQLAELSALLERDRPAADTTPPPNGIAPGDDTPDSLSVAPPAGLSYRAPGWQRNPRRTSRRGACSGAY